MGGCGGLEPRMPCACLEQFHIFVVTGNALHTSLTFHIFVVTGIVELKFIYSVCTLVEGVSLVFERTSVDLTHGFNYIYMQQVLWEGAKWSS